MQLFEYEDKGSGEDPFMINKKGARVQVPASAVAGLLLKGFTLADKTWRPAPTPKKEEEVVLRDSPISRKQLLEEAHKKLDSLDVWEV